MDRVPIHSRRTGPNRKSGSRTGRRTACSHLSRFNPRSCPTPDCSYTAAPNKRFLSVPNRLNPNRASTIVFRSIPSFPTACPTVPASTVVPNSSSCIRVYPAARRHGSRTVRLWHSCSIFTICSATAQAAHGSSRLASTRASMFHFSRVNPL